MPHLFDFFLEVGFDCLLCLSNLVQVDHGKGFCHVNCGGVVGGHGIVHEWFLTGVKGAKASAQEVQKW